ncbi:hypothetical protein HMPREF1531_01087 [Propionibacterium sp. oral taxon 192 str. F0372]|nr:hypothetical protein HMPREF1531_01087 [Propionibacterium sp. oral taxon 192 str. F0372]
MHGALGGRNLSSPSDGYRHARRCLDDNDVALSRPTAGSPLHSAPASNFTGSPAMAPGNRGGAAFGSIPDSAASPEELGAAWQNYRSRRFRSTLGRTVLSAIAPGTGFVGTRLDKLGKVMVVVLIAIAALGAFFVFGNPISAAGAALRAGTMLAIAVGLLLVMGVWIAMMLGTYLVSRPKRITQRQRAAGAGLVSFLALAIALPMSVASAYAYQTAQLSGSIFRNDKESQTRPTLGSDPWAKIDRVNILLLGGDSGEGREEELGIRTDTMMLASIDTHTGATLITQLPRALQHPEFPRGSDLAKVYPYGFDDGAESFISSVWHVVPIEHPELFQNTDYPGADALKYAVEGTTGLKVDYFAMVNIDGLVQLIDAMGGVVVNVNHPIAKGGSTEYGCGQDGWIPEGPDQKLNGVDAMWYARSRCNSVNTDYDRMVRQSCLVNAVIHQADPAKMLTRYEDIAKAAGNLVSTDIPQNDLSAIVDLAGRVKQGNNTQRLAFIHGQNGFDASAPDFELMHQQVSDAIAAMSPEKAPQAPASNQAPAPEPTSQQAPEPTTEQPPAEEPTQPAATDTTGASETESTTVAEQVTDACAYRHEEPSDTVLVPATVPVYTPSSPSTDPRSNTGR